MNKFAWILRGVFALAATSAALLLGLSFAPTLLGYESFVVTSGSMGKANPVGSVAVTRMVGVRTIRAEDVVSFQTDSASRITHRVIAVTEENGQRAFTTKGDANPLADPEPLRLSSGKVARVEWSIPVAGHLVRYARTPLGGVLLFAVPTLGLIVDQRKRPRRQTRSASHSISLPTVASSSSFALSCPHCGEGVAFGLFPLGTKLPESAKPGPLYELHGDQITIPEVTWPESEVISVDTPNGDQITIPEVTWPESEVISVDTPNARQKDSVSKARGHREWNFPLELPTEPIPPSGDRRV